MVTKKYFSFPIKLKLVLKITKEEVREKVMLKYSENHNTVAFKNIRSLGFFSDYLNYFYAF